MIRALVFSVVVAALPVRAETPQQQDITPSAPIGISPLQGIRQYPPIDTQLEHGFYAADASWHLLTVSFGGTVSLLNGLSKQTCENAKGKLPYFKEPECKLPSYTGPIGCPRYGPMPSDIRTAECFQ